MSKHKYCPIYPTMGDHGSCVVCTALTRQEEELKKEHSIFLGTIISQMGGELRVRPSYFVTLPLKFEIESYDDPTTGEIVYRLIQSLTTREGRKEQG